MSESSIDKTDVKNIDDKLKSFRRLLQVMEDLRMKCPWDKKQTMESLSILTIEETYELIDAIADKDLEGVKEELGDLLLHIVFYAKIGEEKNAFDIGIVADDLCDKLIERHPHIYGDVIAETEEQVKENWERIKKRTKGDKRKSILSGVPKSLPALVKAYRIQDKAKQVGFEWENIEQVWDKVDEEMSELKEAISINDKSKIEEEYGDLLFALTNYSRFLNIDPEQALANANKKFISRFGYIEKKAEKLGKDMQDMDLEEMDGYWNEAKTLE